MAAKSFAAESASCKAAQDFTVYSFSTRASAAAIPEFKSDKSSLLFASVRGTVCTVSDFFGWETLVSDESPASISEVSLSFESSVDAVSSGSPFCPCSLLV